MKETETRSSYTTLDQEWFDSIPPVTRRDRARWKLSNWSHLRPWNPMRWSAFTDLPTQKFGYTSPMRCWLQRCGRCHKVRLFGRFCEIYFDKGWHHACPECVLELVEAEHQVARTALSEAGGEG